MTTTIPARTAQPQPVRPPVPAWERHRLFQEPVYLVELAPLEDDDPDDE